MPSPKPRAAKLRLLNGRSPGHDVAGRPVTEPPEFRRLLPLPPMELSPKAAEHWALIVEELARLELTKPLDAGALAAACETWARFADAQEFINSLTPTELYAEGKRHPVLVTVEAASREYRAWCDEFGLTPSAEGRLSPRKEADGDENPFGRPEAQ